MWEAELTASCTALLSCQSRAVKAFWRRFLASSEALTTLIVEACFIRLPSEHRVLFYYKAVLSSINAVLKPFMAFTSDEPPHVFLKRDLPSKKGHIRLRRQFSTLPAGGGVSP